ncbi:GNAT family N-acetyltransferase [Christiangramia aquimixticola]
MTEVKIFETERLWIRPTSTEDAKFVFELFNSPKCLRFIGDRNIHNIDKARLYIEDKMLPQFERLGFSSYTVVQKSDEKKIGACGLYDREGIEGIDLGFAFLREFEKKGYAMEAASFLVKAAKTYFNLKELSAITVEENSGSQKLLEKLGFEFIEFTTIPNDPAKLMLYKKEL